MEAVLFLSKEKKAGGQTGFVLALVFLFVFLFLAAQYESWIVPIAVLLSLPVAALGAYLGIWVTGLHNDIYFQIGLVTLIGLAAKNAILIVEFAKIQVDSGVEVVKAALHAARMRFRPILMTSLAICSGYASDGIGKRDRVLLHATVSVPVLFSGC